MKPNKNHLKCISLAMLGGLSLVSCTNTSHAVLYQHSNLGFNTGIDPTTANIHTRVGMRREFAAIIPKYKVKKNPNQPQIPLLSSPDDYHYQTASTYFGSRTRTSGFWKVPEVAEVMATGAAADHAAMNKKALSFAQDGDASIKDNND